MTIQRLLYEAGQFLKQKNIEDPSREAGLLLSWFLNKDLSFIYAHSDLDLDDVQAEGFWSAVERRGRHEPFAYIAGECEFMSLSFEVNPNVLIPRPDTEVLVEAAIAAFGKGNFNKPMFKLPKKTAYHGLDIGTGSGCIAVSIAKNIPLIFMDAVDISGDALKTARRNAERHGVAQRIRFIESDFLSGSFQVGKKYDLVVSNPPYIPSGDISSLASSVRDYEPHIALAGGHDGLVFYRSIAERAPNLLAYQGILVVECGFNQASSVCNIFAEHSMDSIIIKDYSGINRVIAATLQV